MVRSVRCSVDDVGGVAAIRCSARVGARLSRLWGGSADPFHADPHPEQGARNLLVRGIRKGDPSHVVATWGRAWDGVSGARGGVSSIRTEDGLMPGSNDSQGEAEPLEFSAPEGLTRTEIHRLITSMEVINLRLTDDRVIEVLFLSQTLGGIGREEFVAIINHPKSECVPPIRVTGVIDFWNLCGRMQSRPLP